MKVITIESEAYKVIIDKIDQLHTYVLSKDSEQQDSCTDDDWIDNYEVCTYLRVSERTLQRLRARGVISYTIISGKTYYTLKEIKRVLRERLIKSDEECLEELLVQRQAYHECRRKNKPKKL